MRKIADPYQHQVMLWRLTRLARAAALRRAGRGLNRGEVPVRHGVVGDKARVEPDPLAAGERRRGEGGNDPDLSRKTDFFFKKKMNISIL